MCTQRENDEIKYGIDRGRRRRFGIYPCRDGSFKFYVIKWGEGLENFSHGSLDSASVIRVVGACSNASELATVELDSWPD